MTLHGTFGQHGSKKFLTDVDDVIRELKDLTGNARAVRSGNQYTDAIVLYGSDDLCEIAIAGDNDCSLEYRATCKAHHI